MQSDVGHDGDEGRQRDHECQRDSSVTFELEKLESDEALDVLRDLVHDAAGGSRVV